jgi:serine/threonine protein kinase
MKVCPECARSYSDEAVVCAFDGTPLSTGSTAAWEAIKSAEPTPGDVLGQYRIVERIGRGGMGVIFKAEHVRLGRQVALKVLRSGLIKRTDAVQRFFTEARAVNEIGHPNIVDIIDFVEVVDADPPLVYMVMELLKGESLGERLKRSGPLSPAEVQLIALQIASALSATHEKQILHRDLKPENVYMVGTDDGSVKIKLLDFGVAKAFGGRKGADLTNPGSAVGTPAYMAPEQILERPLDARADIYTLGVLLYQMLTGDVPFKSRSQTDLLVAQVKTPPVPVGEHRPDIPDPLQRVVMTCLEKDPDQRFPDMAAVRSALEAVIGTEVDRPLLPPRKAPLWPLFAVSAVLVLASGVLIWALGTVPEPDPQTRVQSKAFQGPGAAPPADIGSGQVDQSPASGRVDQSLASTSTSDDVPPRATLTRTVAKKQRRRRPRRRRRRPRRSTSKTRPPKTPTKTKATKPKPKTKVNREGTVDPFSL